MRKWENLFVKLWTLASIPLLSYAGIDMNLLNKKAETLKPGSEIVVKLTQENLWKNLQWRLKDGSFFE